MEDTIIISRLRARNLPRNFLLAPLPILQLYTMPGQPPVAELRHKRSTEPTWTGFEYVFKTEVEGVYVGIVLRNGGYVLGRVTVLVDCACREGWFPLGGGAEVYVRIVRLGFCARKVPGVNEGKVVAVDDCPGRGFRRGEVDVDVVANGVWEKKVELKLRLGGQLLKGSELEDDVQGELEGDVRDENEDGDANGNGKDGLVEEHEEHEDEDDDDDDEEAEESSEIESESEDGEYEYVQQQQAEPPPSHNEHQQSNQPPRRVHFDTFSFAVFEPELLDTLQVQLVDKKNPLPSPLRLLNDHTIPLPPLNQLCCTCYQQCNTHIFKYNLSPPGSSSSKTLLQVCVRYTKREPKFTCNVVTPRFRQLFARVQSLGGLFETTFEHSKRLVYLLVPGFFTKQYPTYFNRNFTYLQDSLGLENVHIVPIHTEGSVERNTAIIRDEIIAKSNGDRSVVLIGHSKGALDALCILTMQPDIISQLYGIISFQAPFGGTYLVDHVSKSKLAVNTITKAIEQIWKGDEQSPLDMSHKTRQNQLSEFDSSTLTLFKSIPIIAFATSACFDVLSIRNAANVAGIASMAPAAQLIQRHTGFFCDGLVAQPDALVPFADVVLLEDLMHTEPALYVKGSKYPPGELTATALLLLFEKAQREQS